MDDDTKPIHTDDAPEPESTPRPGIWRGRSWFERARFLFGLLVVVTVAINLVVLAPGPLILLAVPAALVVGAFWVWSLRSERAREAFLPFEAGALVVAVALVAGLLIEMTGGSRAYGDYAFIGLAGGGITTLVVAFLRPLVRGHRSERAVLGTVVGIASLVVALVSPTFDFIDGRDELRYDGAMEASRNLAARYTEDGGIRLNDPYAIAEIQPLGSGYTEACPVELCGTAIAAPATDVAVADATGQVSEPAMGVTDVAPPAPAPIPGFHGSAPVPSPEGNVSLELAPSGDTRLRVASAIVRDVGTKVRAEVRAGDCADPSRKVVDSWSLTAAQLDSDTDIVLVVDVDPADLSLDDQLSVVVGIDKPLGTVRCATLVSASGIILAKEGADSFGRECVAPLRLPDSDRIRLTPSSFQDRPCAARFTRLSTIASGAIVRDRKAYRVYDDCMANVPIPEPIQLADGQLAVPSPTSDDIRDLDLHIACLPPGSNTTGVSYGGAAPMAMADPAVGMAEPATAAPAPGE